MEHTCTGMYDLTCKACQELLNQVWEANMYELDDKDVDDLYQDLGGEG